MPRNAQNSTTGFLRKADLPAIVGEFLTNVRLEDLVVELVQNELDSAASTTLIAFTEDALVCEGNGKRVDAKGWKRLETIVGAGGSVAAKEGGIGAKNHGLRTAFLLGDSILVQSAGQSIQLSLFEDSERRELDPGAWPRRTDRGAPSIGTRVTVPYRRSAISIPGGQGFSLVPLPRERLEALYETAIEEMPRRLLAAATLAVKGWRLTLAFLGRSVTYDFRILPSRRRGKDAVRTRECRRLNADGSWTVVLRERFREFLVRLGPDDSAKVPKCFRRRGRILGEVAWSIDARGRPVPMAGKLRYPIAYPDTDSDAYTHHGFHVTAPFISDTARHGVAQNAARNDTLLVQAREAFVDALRTCLIPLHGGEVLQLVRRPDQPNLALERKLLAQALAAAALPVYSRRAVGRRSAPERTVELQPEWRLAIASYSRQSQEINYRLFWLAQDSDQILSPRVPAFAVQILLELAKSDPIGRQRLVHLTEANAAQVLAPPDDDERRQMEHQVRPIQLERSITAMRTLEHCRSRYGLPDSLINELLTRGLLPTRSGHERPWKAVWYSRDDAPEIDGASKPILLHESMVDFPAFREGRLKIERFQLDTYLVRLVFSKAGREARTQFFRWLCRHQVTLKPATLTALAKQPFWPAADGGNVPLDAFCVPPSRNLRRAMVDVLTVPTDEVLAQRWLNRTRNPALRLRQLPSDDELRHWYTTRSARLAALEVAGDSVGLTEASLEFDRGLELLQREPTLWPSAKSLATGHRTVSRAGALACVSELHRHTPATQACALLENAILAGRSDVLYRALNARPVPSALALRDALLADPRQSVLFVRLESYAATGQPLEALEHLAIIPTENGIAAPADLAFPIQRDLWGAWRRTWAPPSLIPERVELLAKAGVAGRTLTEKLSRGFFTWLSAQPDNVQAAHTPQVLRHFHDRQRGPLKWRLSAMDMPCIPVRGKRRGVHLISFAQALRRGSRVLLPDFPVLHEEILERDANRLLVVTNVEGVQGTILGELRRMGVQSLRQALGQPVSLTVGGEIEFAGEQFRALLRKLRSERMAEELPKRLELHGIPSADLHRNWRTLASRLKDVRHAPWLLATYALGGLRYELPIPSALSTDGGVIYIRRVGDPVMAFYGAVAELLFADCGPLTAYGLRQAIEQPFDPDVRRSGALDLDLAELPPPAPGPAPLPCTGHGLSAEDLAPLVPAPKPFPSDKIAPPLPPPAGTGAKPTGRSSRAPAATDRLRQSLAEHEQIRQLKEEHYACHCQACLGAYDPIVATPPDTYLSVTKYRHANVQAHHVDHLQNGGDLGARNLLILCSFHHDLLGDRLSGAVVREALATAALTVRRFPTGEGQTEVKGSLANVPIDVAPWTAKLFFTSHHADIWLP